MANPEALTRIRPCHLSIGPFCARISLTANTEDLIGVNSRPFAVRSVTFSL
jgi:hypothetical protein